ncbi:MAG: hypothetical protein ACTHW3_10815, partial [Leucobacter sp.]
MIFVSDLLAMIGGAQTGGLGVMAHTPSPTHFSDRLTSRRGAWVALGVAVALLVALFGLFGSADAPARTGHAPADAESTQVSELMEKFPNA